MTILQQILLIFSCLFLWVSRCDAADCYMKNCECDIKYISCEERSLTTIPEITGTNNTYYTTLSLNFNLLTTIPAGALPPNLTTLSLLQNPITSIDPAAFDASADTLQFIQFMRARFTTIPDAFSHLKALTSLEIHETPIQNWNPEAMKKIGQTLTNIYLDSVDLTSWPDWVQYCTKLTQISITGNTFTTMPDNALDPLVDTLTSLQLNNNSLTAVPFAISKLRAIRILALDKNKISNITWLPETGNLSSLALNGNRMSDSIHLSNELRPYANTLFDIDLRGNRLTSIPELDFLIHISELDIADNLLSDPVSGSFPPLLDTLKIHKNKFAAIPKAISKLTRLFDFELNANVLERLDGISFPPYAHGCDLQDNQIKELTETSFPVNANITYVMLQNNPLKTISLTAFKNLRHLVELNLDNTKLTRIPLALGTLPKIDVLTINNRAGLVCTCEERSLAPWIMNITNGNVHGNCGMVTVIDFFATLSVDCPDVEASV